MMPIMEMRKDYSPKRLISIKNQSLLQRSLSKNKLSALPTVSKKRTSTLITPYTEIEEGTLRRERSRYNLMPPSVKAHYLPLLNNLESA